MINKRISKITIFASLLVVGVVNAQEFYTCVPKKSWWGDVIRENVEKGVRKGQIQEWNLIKKIDFTKILKDGNLNHNNISVLGNLFFTAGLYRFKLFLKNKDGNILTVFVNNITINKNKRLFFDSLDYACRNGDQIRIREFYSKYNLDKLVFLQNRNLINLPTCGSSSFYIGIGLLRLGSEVLFNYEYISGLFKLYDESFIVNEKSNSKNTVLLAQNPLNIFRYSTLEIYKQNDS